MSALPARQEQIATLAPGSTFAMTFMLPIDLLEPEDRRAFEWAQKGAAASGTPFATAFAPTETLELAREAGFKEARHVSGATLAVVPRDYVVLVRDHRERRGEHPGVPGM